MASVLEGAEDALSVFFTNPTSTLRKVKANRVKSKQMAEKTKDNSISTDTGASDDAVSSEQTTAYQETEGHPPTVLKAGDVGITQWSPLSLSEIPISTGRTFDHNTSSKEDVKNFRAPEELQHDFDFSQRGRPQVNTRHTGLTKKTRTFVYSVETPKQQSLADTQSQKVELFPVIQQDVNITPKAKSPELVSRCSVKENDTKCQEDLSDHSVKAKLQDLDISQLSKDFAQDFSQIQEPSLGKDRSQNFFSPSACLSALKQTNKKKQADISNGCDVSNRSVFASNQKSLIDESTISDSGFLSNVGNGTHIAVSSVCENDIHKTSSNEETGNNCLAWSVIPVMKNEQCMSARRNVNWMSPYEKDQSTKEKMCPSTVASGFKTASNKGIHVLSANLERAKHVFEESVSYPNRNGICDSKDEPGPIHKLAKNTISTCNSNQTLSFSWNNVENGPHLTTSQKADMTELCTLLEEADSQFEFTQFGDAETKQPCQENAASSEKHHDAEFLTGINFDDSFNSDAEKHLTQDKKSDISCKLSNVTCESTSLSSDAVKLGKYSEDVTRISQGTVSTEQHVLCKENNLMLGFKTAGGNILKVSKRCMSKARDLFADLEPHFLHGMSQSEQNGMDSQMHNVHMDRDARLLNFQKEQHNSTVNRRVMGDRNGSRNSNTHASEYQNGFQLASGKVIYVSEKALQDAAALFSYCDTVDNISDTSVRRNEGVHPASGNDNHKSNLQKCKNVQGIKEECTKREIPEFEKRKDSLTTDHTDLENESCGTLSSPTKAVSSPFTSIAPRHIGSFPPSATNTGTGLSNVDKVVVSADALKKPHCLFSDINTSEDTNQLVASQKLLPPLGNCGFQTASGKGVSISNAALKKAKLLLQDCGDDEVNIGEEQPKIPFTDPPRSFGFHTASGKAAPCSSEALQKAKALLSNITFNVQSVQANHDGQKQNNSENKTKIHCGFSTAGGAKVHISQKSLLKAKNLLREFDSVPEIQEAENSLKVSDIVGDHDQNPRDHVEFSVKEQLTFSVVSGVDEMNHTNVFINIPPGGSGFHTASGRAVSVSDAAMMKAQDLLDESVTLEGRKEHHKPKIDTLPAQNVGFQTASGRKVSVSNEAMMKAQSLLNEDVTLEGIKEQQKAIPAQDGGFQMASGKRSNISSAALQQAKTLFSESVEDKPSHSKIPFLAGSGKKMSFSPETPREGKAVSLSVEFSHTKQGEHEGTFKNREIIQHGFTTAGGAKVHVSQKSLLKAKNLLNDIDDGQTSFSNSCSTSQCDTENLLRSRNLPKASNKNVLHRVKSSNSLLVIKHKGQNIPSGVSPSSVGSSAEMSRTKRTELSNVTITDKSSLLCLQSFDINDCSETQQRFLAQEALDCTKALLEDERFLLDHDPQQTDKSADDRRRKGKRLVVDPDLPGKCLHRPLLTLLLNLSVRCFNSRPASPKKTTARRI